MCALRYEACDDMPEGWTVICDEDEAGLTIYFDAALTPALLADQLTKHVGAHAESYWQPTLQRPA